MRIAPAAPLNPYVAVGQRVALEVLQDAVRRAAVATSDAGDYDPTARFWTMRTAHQLGIAAGAAQVAAVTQAELGTNLPLQSMQDALEAAVQLMTAAPLSPSPSHTARTNELLRALDRQLDQVLAAPAPDVPPRAIDARARMLMRNNVLDIRAAAHAASRVLIGPADGATTWAALNHTGRAEGLMRALAGLQMVGASVMGVGLSLRQLEDARTAIADGDASTAMPLLDEVAEAIRILHAGPLAR